MTDQEKTLLQEQYYSGYFDYNVHEKKASESAEVPEDAIFYADEYKVHIYTRKYPKSYSYSEHLQARQVKLISSIRTWLICIFFVPPALYLVTLMLSASW